MASSSSRTQMCQRFLKTGSCVIKCKYIHNYIYCSDFQNGNRCKRKMCRFLHVSTLHKNQYNNLGIATDEFWDEVQRTKQIAGVCKFYLKGHCNKEKSCSLQHLSVEEIKVNSPTCPVCLTEILAGNLSVTNCCTYAICVECVRRLALVETSMPDQLFKCPCCRLYTTALNLKT